MNEVVAERTLPANELQVLSKIIEQATEGVVIIDLDGIVWFVNTAWGEMHGYGNAADLLGEHIKIFHTKEQMRSELASLLEETKRRGRIAGPIDHVKRDGTTFPTQTKILLLKSPSNEPSSFIILAADCTDGRKNKARLKQLSAELDQLRGTNEQLGKQVAQLKAANEQLRDQTAEQEGLTGRLNDCREHANDLERRATELEAQNRQYEEQAAEHRKLASELNDLEQQIAELTQGKERLQQQACNHNETEERLRQEVAELEQRNIELKQQTTTDATEQQPQQQPVQAQERFADQMRAPGESKDGLEQRVAELVDAKTIASEILGISGMRFWLLRARGRVGPKPIKVNGTIRWELSSILRWIEWNCCDMAEFQAREVKELGQS